MFGLFSGLENYLDTAIEVLRPFVSVFIPVYNFGYTVISIIVLFISIILVVLKHFGIDDRKILVNLAKIKPAKRGIIRMILLSGKELSLIWLAWSYGAHYMASMVFARMIIFRLFTRVANNIIEYSKDKAVQIVDEAKGA
jgi:hypothetical protein